MSKLVFLILHYQVIEQTINCIKSIKEKIDTENYEIVVVDNNSSNGTGKELQELYKNETNVHIILNNKNLGFAKGNNIGFNYAKKNLKPDFIVMLNNDTCIIQDDFYQTIKKEYEKSNFAVLGPKIILLNGDINPLNTFDITLENVKRERKNVFFKLFLNYFFIDNVFTNMMKSIKQYIKKIIGYKSKEIKINPDKRHEDIILHGSCLVFSPVYIEKFDGLDDRTFLYHEEELLYLRLKKNNMLSVYNPKLLIFHEEDAATNSVIKSEYKKRRFIYKNVLKSNKVLLDELKSE